jgi:hypothetical protein
MSSSDALDFPSSPSKESSSEEMMDDPECETTGESTMEHHSGSCSELSFEEDNTSVIDA